MAIECFIDFENNPSKVVYTGQLLRGNVQLKLTEPKNVRGVYIKIKGKAYAHWTEGSGDNRKSYTGEEEYINERTYFVGGNSGEVRLLPGSYNYTFQCFLPHQLPTSFEGEHGHIRYTACVTLDIPLWPDKDFEVPFTVIKAINLNADPTLRQPVIAKKHKTFYPCCLLCCCQSDPLIITGRTPVGGYTPGQTINLLLNVENKSDQPISDFSVQLIKKVVYYTHSNSSRNTTETIVVTEEETRGCDLNQEEVIHINFVVPAIPPTDNTTSNIIKVNYLIRIIGSVAACHSDPVIELPVVIGSYPILDNPQPGMMNSYPPVNPMPMPSVPMNNVISQQPTAPSVPSIQNGYPLPYASPSTNVDGNSSSTLPYPSAPSAPFAYPNDEPPTYEDAMQFGKEQRDFKPKYPMFKRQTSYSSGN